MLADMRAVVEVRETVMEESEESHHLIDQIDADRESGDNLPMK